VILAELYEATDMLVGTRRKYFFQKGYYAYVGSALSGLEPRIRRHLSPEKKRHWHIDYLVEKAKIKNIIYAETGERKECHLATLLSQKLTAVDGFGCSDCRCRSHLFFCSEWQALESFAIDALISLSLEPFSTANNHLA